MLKLKMMKLNAQDEVEKILRQKSFVGYWVQNWTNQRIINRNPLD